MNELIRIEGLKKYYDRGKSNEVYALRGVDLTLDKGETVALAGVSGSGKSTLLHIVGAMDRASEGKYFFDGKDMTSASPKELAKMRADAVGFVFQQYGLQGDLTVEENIRLALCFLSDGNKAKERRKHIGELLAELGIEDLIFRKASQLSGGQKQRVAIARALIKEPLVIIADEPTAALDKGTGKDVIKLLTEKAKKQRIALIAATHDTGILDSFDRVIDLENGVIVRQSPIRVRQFKI